MRDFGKFWEVLGRGSGETLQTTHKARNHGGTPNKTLKSSQYLSKTPTSAALYRLHAAEGIQYRDETPRRVVSGKAGSWVERPSERFWEILGGFG